MNKLLVAVFESELAADAGLHALRALHAEGDITLYATGVIAKDADGLIRVMQSDGQGALGTGLGLAVGSLIGLLGGPAGVVVGAVTGAAAGAVRDFWAAGVGLDFIEEAQRNLKPGKVALVAEIEEEWVVPVDSALESRGGVVLRRTRSSVAEAQYDHDIAAIKGEIKTLEAEAARAGAAVKETLRAKIDATKGRLDDAVRRAADRVVALKSEADAKAESLGTQLSQVGGDVKAKVEERVRHVRSAYHARGAKLSQAWDLAKEALTV